MAIKSLRCFEEVAGYESYCEQLPVMSELVTRLCQDGDGRRGGKVGVFDGKVVVVSVNDYLVRLCKYGGCSKAVFMLMFVYLRRLLEHSTEFIIRSNNIHRLLLALYIIAAKSHDDHFYSNSFYSKVGGISTLEVNRLEAALLTAINWDLYVSREEYEAAVEHLTPREAL